MFFRSFFQIPQPHKRNNYEIELQMIKFRFFYLHLKPKDEFPVDHSIKIEDEI